MSRASPSTLRAIARAYAGHQHTAPDALHELASRVRRLAPSHRDPEAFHHEKDEIARELRRLARKVGEHGND